MGETRLGHAQIAFRFIEKVSDVHRRVSVGRQIFPRSPKLVGYEADRKESRMKSVNVHASHLHGESYELIAVVCQFGEFKGDAGAQTAREARVSRAGFDVSPKQSLKKSANPGRVESLAVASHPLQRQHARRVRYPIR